MLRVCYIFKTLQDLGALMSNIYIVGKQHSTYYIFRLIGKEREAYTMNKDAIKMINMAQSISKMNGWDILRMDLQRCKMGNIQYYVLYMVYEGDREITIRQDCTIVGYDD